MTTTGARVKEESLAQVMEQRFGENVYACYQCLRCSSGCPLSEHFDLTPSQVMRYLQLGIDDTVLRSKTIWLCSSCQACSTRCPQGLDLVRIMDELKAISKERDIEPAVSSVPRLYDIFLRDVRLLGRTYELGLAAELGLRSGDPFKDLPMGLEMLRKGKFSILPSRTSYPRRISRQEVKSNQMAYYPGCSLHSTAAELNASIRSVFRELGVDLVEPKGWVCCGSTPAHATDHFLATRMAMRNLTLIERRGFEEVMVACLGCFSRFKWALHDVANEPELKQRVDEELGYEYQDNLNVRYVVDVLADNVGLPAIAQRVRKPLEGLRVVCYYGCVYTRPPKVTQAQHIEYPMTLDHIVESVGVESLDWSYKTECCGATLSMTETDLALHLTRKILDNARAVGAEAVVVSCPLCHMNLDARQRQLELDYSMPILYITQLIGLAFGLPNKELALDKNIVSPHSLLQEKRLLATAHQEKTE
ncbi:MAG: heterodisulfide reductase-related iron-sulfur binding cluster [Anaerolineae bacterium]